MGKFFAIEKLQTSRRFVSSSIVHWLGNMVMAAGRSADFRFSPFKERSIIKVLLRSCINEIWMSWYQCVEILPPVSIKM